MLRLIYFLRAILVAMAHPSAVWICATSIHLMLASQFAVENQCRVICLLVPDSPLATGYFLGLGKKMPIVSGPLRQVSLLLYIVACLIRNPFRKPSIYVPHVSQYFFSRPSQLGLMMRLNRYGFVCFYDDGIGSMSLHTLPWEMKLISCRQADLVSWDYRFLRSTKSRQKMLSCLSAYNLFSALLLPASIPSGPKAWVETGNLSEQSFVLASKWINWPQIIKLIGEDRLVSTTYLPHFAPHKNNQYLLQSARKWTYTLPPELILPRILNDFHAIYFGVTSTIPFVIEVMLSLGGPIRPLFVLSLDPNLVDRPREAEDFAEKLMYYHTHHAVQIQVLPPLPATPAMPVS